MQRIATEKDIQFNIGSFVFSKPPVFSVKR